jgi:hypothetical protein
MRSPDFVIGEVRTIAIMCHSGRPAAGDETGEQASGLLRVI